MPLELVYFGFSVLGGLIGMLLFCLIWEDGFRLGLKRTKGGKIAKCNQCGYPVGPCPSCGAAALSRS